MSFLGLDFGASFVKGGVLDPVSGTVRAVSRTPFPGFVEGLPPGRREVDPAAILQSFNQALDLLLEAEPEPEGLVVCSQMHGFILVDEEGRPLSNYHSWQDRRVEEIDPRSGRTFFAEMSGRLSEDDQASVGREVRSGLPAGQLFWLAEKQQIPARARARACSLPDFILAHAAGKSPVIEPTLASGFGLFNLRTGQWHDEVAARLNLPRGLLPEIVPTGRVVGMLERRGRKIPCYTPVGDQQCALAGIGLQEEELSLNIGTGSQVSLRARTSSPGPYQVRPYFGGEFLRTITHIPAGRSLNALLKLLTELNPDSDRDQTWSRVLEKLDGVSGTDTRADLSFFPAAFGSEGAWTHLREDHLTVGHLFLAALENMAANYRRAADQVSPEKGWNRAILSGGLVHKIPRLRALIEKAIPCPQRLSSFPEDTLQGLLVLAGSWCGKKESSSAIQNRDTDGKIASHG